MGCLCPTSKSPDKNLYGQQLQNLEGKDSNTLNNSNKENKANNSQSVEGSTTSHSTETKTFEERKSNQEQQHNNNSQQTNVQQLYASTKGRSKTKKIIFKTTTKVDQSDENLMFVDIEFGQSEIRLKVFFKNLEQYKDKIMERIKIVERFDHPSLLKITRIEYKDEKSIDTTEFNEINIVFDDLTNSEKLSSSISQFHHNYEEISKIMAQIFYALHYIHEQQFYHQKLLPDCFLISKTTNSIILYDLNYISDLSITAFTSPELVQKSQSSDSDYKAQKSDIWSSGMILFNLITSNVPFNQQDDLANQILSFDSFIDRVLPQINDEDAKDLFKELCTMDPLNRITPQEALNHKFIQKFEKNNISIEESLQDMNQYSGLSDFHKLIQYYISNNFNKPEYSEKIKECFISLDTDKNGVLTKEEIQENIDNLSDEKYALFKQTIINHLDEIIQTADINNDNQIQLSEFVSCSINLTQQYTEDELGQIFDTIDSNGDQKLSKKELHSSIFDTKEFNTKASQLWDNIIEQLDEDIDDYITKPQFLKLVQNMKNQYEKEEDEQENKFN